MSSSAVKTRISITILPAINLLLERKAAALGMSKSSLIEKAVDFFLAQQLDRDTKALANLNFADLPTEDEWMSL